MEFFTQLWMPIVVSALVAWIISAIIWTAMPHRKKEWGGVTDEDDFRKAITSRKLKPGNYMFPYCEPAEMKDEAHKNRMNTGPYGTLYIWTHRRGMGACMGGSFVFNLVASFFIAYIAWQALTGQADTAYLKVFQITGATAFLTYTFALIPGGIWFGKPVRSMVYDAIEGLVIALMIAGVFGWLWPRAAEAADAAANAASALTG